MRRVVAGSLLRSAVTSTVLLVLYYDAPLDRPLDGLTGVLFLAALALFGSVIALQLRGILRSDHPRLQAVQAVAVGLPLLWVLFAATYWIVAAEQADAFTEPLDRTDALYFTITTFTTVGFGDIAATSELARILVTVQMLVGLVTVGVLAKLVLGAVHVAVARRDGAAGAAPVRDEPVQPGSD